jgi:hypothetical protein
MKDATKVSFIYDNIDFNCKKIEVIIDGSNYDTYAVVTPVKNMEIVENNK